jgi:hypothetical protein
VTRRPSALRAARASVALVIALLTLTACAKGSPMTDTPAATGPGPAPAERPSLRDAVERYDRMLGEMRAVIAASAPGSSWAEAKAAGTAAGDESLAGAGALIGRSALWVLDAPLPADPSARSDVVAAVGRVGQEYGFTAVSFFVDLPGEAQAVGYDAFGAEYRLSSIERASVRYTTGSHPVG